jgi:hypothetical protein
MTKDEFNKKKSGANAHRAALFSRRAGLNSFVWKRKVDSHGARAVENSADSCVNDDLILTSPQIYL